MFKFANIVNLRELHKYYFCFFVVDMKLRFLGVFIILFGISFNIFSQGDKYQDSSYFAPLIKISYAAQLPEGDLKDRFGFNSNIGLHFNIKTKKYWTFGLKGTFIWGNKLVEDSILRNLAINTDEKFNYINIIDENGELARVFFDERGFTTMFTFGRVFNILAPNKNSGFILNGGVGFLQHKIKFQYKDSKLPNIEGEYAKGYDRLSNGLAFEGFFGYVFLSKSRLVNFYGGFEYNYALTYNRRGYNFDTQQYDTKQRTDILYGFRVGWILPLYKSKPQDFYYY